MAGIKPPKWSIHIDHPWSEDVKEFGAPLRIYVWTPWRFIQIGAKSQKYDYRIKKYTDKWAYIVTRPRSDA